MITSRVTVVGPTADGLAVEASGPATCPRCAAGRGCGGGVFGRLVGGGPRRVLVDDPIGLGPGEVALIGLSGASLLRAVLETFAWPLLGLFLAASLPAAGSAEALVALAGLGGLALGIALARMRVRALLPLLRPRVLARCPVERDCQAQG